jgi:nucleoside-diphosphate-sugar epimerase
MKILITGGAGGIGSTLAYALSKTHQVAVVDSLRNGYIENLSINNKEFCKFFLLDIRSNAFIEFVKNEKPDIIIHLAAITSLPDCESNINECIDINVTGTLNVLESARLNNIKRVIFASTSAVYENNQIDENNGFTEDLIVNPRLFYSLSKKLSEEICISYEKNYGMEIPILRLFNVFGPRQDIHRKSPPLLNYLVRELKNNRQPVLHSNGEQKRDYIHINDVIEAFTICLTNPNAKNNIFNISSGNLLSVKDIVRYTKEALGINIDPIYRSAKMLWDDYPKLFEGKLSLDKNIVEKETNKFSLGNNSKAKRVLNWNPNENLESLIKDTVKQIKL